MIHDDDESSTNVWGVRNANYRPKAIIGCTNGTRSVNNGSDDRLNYHWLQQPEERTERLPFDFKLPLPLFVLGQERLMPA